MIPSVKLFGQSREAIRRATALALAATMAVGLVPVGAIATPTQSLPTPTGLTDQHHADESVWYSDSASLFAWDTVAGSDGYSYSFDQQMVDSALDAVADPVTTSYVARDPGDDIARSRDVVLADMNGDGSLDAVSGSGDGEHPSTVVVTSGSAAGEFGSVATYDIPFGSPIVSVDAGDLDGDGDQDVVAVAPRTNDYDASSFSGMYVLLNDGSGALAAPVAYVPAGRAEAVEIADFNKDGKQDLVVVSNGYPNNSVSLYYGAGDGSFGTPETAYIQGGSTDLTVGDINADGWLDIVTVAGGGYAYVTMVMNREGHFTDASNLAYPVGAQASSVDLGDVDEDGRVDIITGNGDSYRRCTVLKNTDNAGGWTTLLGTIGYYWDAGGLRNIEVVDMDGDSHLDVVGFSYDPYYAQPYLRIYKGAGDGTFATDPIQVWIGGEVWSSFDVADLNGDGVMDIAASPWGNAHGIVPVIAGPTMQYEGTSDGEWYFHLAAVGDGSATSEQVTRRIRIDTTAPELSISGVTDGGVYVVGEVPQVVITAADSMSGVSSVWLEDENGDAVEEVSGDTLTFDLPPVPGSYTISVRAEDMAGNEVNNEFSVLLVGSVAELASATHPSPAEFYSANTAKFTWDVTLGAQYSYILSQDAEAEVDLEADVVADTSGAPAVATYPTAYCPESAVTADFNDDGWMDYALAFDDDDGIVVHLNNGDGTFETDEQVLDDSYYYDMSDYVDDLNAVDMDLDGSVDLVYVYQYEDKVGIMWGNGDGSFEMPAEYSLANGEYPSSLDVADIDGDIYPDIVVSYDGSRRFEVWRRDSEDNRVYTSQVVSYEMGSGNLWADAYEDDYFYGAVAIADINDDRLNDVVVGMESGRLAVYLNAGDGTFSGDNAYAITVFDGTDPECIVAEDLTGDGRVEIIASIDNDDVVLSRDGEGGWVQTFTESTDGDSDDITTGDFNGDGLRDYAYALDRVVETDEDWFEVSTLYLRLGEGDGGFVSGGEIELPDLSSDGKGIASADFNGDGLDDIVMSGSDDTAYVITMTLGGDFNAIGENLEDGIWYFRVRQIGGEGEGVVGGPVSTMQVNVGEELTTRALQYVADDGGTIEGEAAQEVFLGSLGTTVTAVAGPGYRFTGWSDGVATSERRDQANVDLEVTAGFALDTEIIENGSVKVTVAPDGTPAIRIWSESSEEWVYQYYSEDSWGTVLWLDDVAYTTGYIELDSVFDPISNEVIEVSGGQRIVTKLAAGESGVVLTQTITLMAGDRQVTKEWTVENGGSETVESIRLYHGGDTYFGGEDSASGYYDAAKSMVYIRNDQFEDWGIMGFYANPATPATHYFEGDYSDGDDYASRGSDLPDTVDSEFLDAGYYLQWDGGDLAPDTSWSVEANEIWTPGGPIQVLAPAPQNVLSGTTVVLPFTIQNLSEVPQDLTLTASATGEWSARVLGSAAPEVGAVARTEVLVEVTVPEGATAAEIITLRAVGDETNASGSTRLSIAPLDLEVSPTSLNLSARIGETTSEIVVVTNNGDSPVTLGTPTAVNPFAVASVSPESMVLGAGESAEIEVEYTATEEVATAGVLSIPVVAPVRVTLTASLAGTGKPLAPPAPDSPYYSTTGPRSTMITWVGNDEALGYEVWVRGVLAGSVGAGVNSFVYAGTLGPNAVVTVISMGESDNSESVRAAYLAVKLAKVGQIQFGGFSSGLTKETKGSIRALVRLVKQQGYTRVQLDGYSAQVAVPGGVAFRKWLSARRANEVRKYMVAEMKRQGVSVKVVAFGRGGDNPLSSNKTASGRAANRRVEVSLR